MKTKDKTSKRIPYVDYTCSLGERVRWRDITGKPYEGIIENWIDDHTVAIIKLDDGSEKVIYC